MIILDVQDVKKTYNMGTVQVSALQGVSFTVQRGEFVAIMGPSGSGKSTLMNIIGCLDRPTSGKYLLDGKNVGRQSDAARAHIRNQKIGFVFQSFNLLPRVTALKNVLLPMMYAGQQRVKKGREVLETVGLSHRIHHTPLQLSGGEQQRVAIARALVNDPPIIFGDEPTGNLDSVTSVEIMAIFQQLNREGKTVIIVTHEAEIAQHANRILVFQRRPAHRR